MWFVNDGGGNAAVEDTHQLVEPADLAAGELSGAGVYEGTRVPGCDTPGEVLDELSHPDGVGDGGVYR